jgi:hypothetical protein
LCDVGIEVGAVDLYGRALHTGDIVIISHGEYIGTDAETWTPSNGLTAVVADQYQSFSDGSVKLDNAKPEPFVMGIKGCGFDAPDWHITIVKKFSDVIDGEHWASYGFNYAMNVAADSATGAA